MFLSLKSLSLVHHVITFNANGVIGPTYLRSSNKYNKGKMAIVGLGNILFDIVVKETDDALLSKYGLKKDGHKEMNKEDLKSLMNEISKYNLSYSPGGAAQNTIRVLQWILQNPGSTCMIGGIGQDSLGIKLRKLVEEDGVKTRYIEVEGEPTGTTVALINGACRSLVANIGASEKITVEQVESNSEVQAVLSEAKLFYMEGFFVTQRAAVAKYFLDYSKIHKKAFVFNIGAVYLSEEVPNDMRFLAENCDILFGNKTEYAALCKVFGAENTESLMQELCTKYEKETKYGKIVVITNGSESVNCMHSKNKKEVLAVPKIDEKDIKDTVGAGDAFVAGFLAGIFSAADPLTCLKWGCNSAREIIQQYGCTLPPHSSDCIREIS